MFEYIAISSIKENPNNPRFIRDEKYKKLIQSIKDFPKMLELRPVVIDNDMVVLGGNMRLKACKELGLKEIPVIKTDDLTDEQKKEFIIKDNVWFGENNWEILANEWNEIDLKKWWLDFPWSEEKEEKKKKYKIFIECETSEEQEKIYEEIYLLYPKVIKK